MKKLLTSLMCLVLFCGCSSMSNRADSVEEIKLSIDEHDYYKNEDIVVNIETNCMYQIVPTDFVMFGGTVEVNDLHTATLTFPSAGTFHVYAIVNDVKSNEITVKVVSENAYAIRTTQEDDEPKPKKEIVRNPPEIPYTEKDFMNIETLYYADPSELANSDYVAEHIKDYTGYMFAMQAYMPDDGTTGYLLSSEKGRHIPIINGYSVTITGPIRVYGLMEENGFHIKIFSYGS